MEHQSDLPRSQTSKEKVSTQESYRSEFPIKSCQDIANNTQTSTTTMRMLNCIAHQSKNLPKETQTTNCCACTISINTNMSTNKPIIQNTSPPNRNIFPSAQCQSRFAAMVFPKSTSQKTTLPGRTAAGYLWAQTTPKPLQTFSHKNPSQPVSSNKTLLKAAKPSFTPHPNAKVYPAKKPQAHSLPTQHSPLGNLQNFLD